MFCISCVCVFLFQAEDGIRDLVRSRGLGDVYKRQVITMVHEGGHAIHSMLNADLDFIAFKEVPSEIAELASMGMELISMEHWHHFFTNEDDLKRAKREQLENVIEACLLYTSPSPRDRTRSRMPSSA